MTSEQKIARPVAPGIIRVSKAAGIGTAITLATYLLLMLAGAYRPEFLACPITEDSAISIGIALGTGSILLLMGYATAFNAWRNRAERR